MAKRKKTADSPSELIVGTTHETTLPLLNPPDTPASRRKKTATSRIGRACDRCQHRKLACDPAPEGCPPCQRVNAWCTVTDPLTGTPTYRGEFEYLEHQVARQHDDIKTLVQRLKELGEDVSRYEEESPADRRYKAWTQVKASGDTRPWDREEKQLNVSRHLGSQPAVNGIGGTSAGPGGVPTDLPIPMDAASNEGVLKLPDLRPGLAQSDPNKYVGVAVNYPGSGKGAKLNILGWQLDMAQFMGKDLEGTAKPVGNGDPIFDRSYRSFIATAFGQNPKPEKPDLPAKNDLIAVVGAFVQYVHPFAPLFHGPSFMALASKVYDEPGFVPSIAEEVCLHLVIATMICSQARATEEGKAYLHAKADQHYHYALGFYPHLILNDKLEDCQAMAMIAIHVRSYPAPEVGWAAAMFAFNKLVQLGFHRSVKNLGGRRSDRSFRDVEVSKRVFWTSLCMVVTANGKLGRPMPIRVEDFDVEVPMAVSDEQLLESGVDSTKPGKCTFLPGLEAHKVSVIYLELYNGIYATKRSSKEYMQYVGIAERRIKGWQDQWPAEFKQPMDEADYEMRVAITHLRFWGLEFKLLLHHPSLSLTKSYQFNDNNLRACLEASKDILQTVRSMQELQCMDVNWGYCAVYLLAIQTTFYGYGQLKEELTDVKLAELKSDMEQWLSIMREIGKLLGSGRRLHNTVAELVKAGMTQLNQHLKENLESEAPAKEESPPSPEVKTEPSSSALEQHAPTGNSSIQANYSTYSKHPQSDNAGYQGSPTYANPPDMQQALNAYSSPVQYSFPPQQAAANAYTTHAQAYGQPAYAMNMQAPPPMASSFGQQSSAHHSTGSMGGMYDASHHQHQHQQQYAAAAAAAAANNTYGPDSDSWYQYTQSIPNQMSPSDYQPAASALLQLGGRPDASMGTIHGGLGGGDAGYDASGVGAAHNMMWSLNVMDGSHQGNQ